MMKGGGAAGRDKFGGQYTSSTTSKTTTRTYRGVDGVMVTEVGVSGSRSMSWGRSYVIDGRYFVGMVELFICYLLNVV